MESIANPALVEEVKRRVQGIESDVVYTSGELAQLIEDKTFALLPQLLLTERPDRAASFLMDGMVLLAFLLGFPANEIVLPVLLMGYLQTGTLTAYGSLAELSAVLTANGWTTQTAVCMLVLCLLHFPCGTTCLTILRETGSARWTALAAALPTAMGAALCMAIHGVWTLLG